MKIPSPLSFSILSLSMFQFLGCASIPEDGVLTSVSIPNDIERGLQISALPGTVKYVELETTEDSFISLIQDIQFHEGLFYVTDFPGKILVFDQSGRFIGRIGKEGEGPGEFFQMSSMVIDGAKGNIHVSSQNRLITYSVQNGFIEEHKYPYFIDYLTMIDGGLSLIAAHDGKEEGGKFVNRRILYKVDSDFGVVDSMNLVSVETEKPTAATYPYKHYISSIDEEVFVYSPVLINEGILRDTLFRFEAMKIVPVLKLNFEGPLFDKKDRKLIVIKNVSYSRNYVLCEYSRAGEERLFLGKRDGSFSVNLKAGLTLENEEIVMLRPFKLADDEFYFVQNQKFSGKAVEEHNPKIGIVRLE